MKPAIEARFQRNNDGQFVGKFMMDGEEMDCWLVFDEHYKPATDPAFLMLSFEEPAD